MITVRPADARGRADFGWLDSRHSFSFGSYYDRAQMGFGALRVINEDRVAGGGGFDPHGHRDMEILSWVLEGGLEHQDSLGNRAIIRPGELQRMTAGTGVQHSEFNASPTEPVHFLQIWILPERQGLTPGYDQRQFPPALRHDRLCCMASPDGRDGSVRLHQDATLYAASLSPGLELDHALEPGRRAWLQVTQGDLWLDDTPLAVGDGAAVTDATRLRLTSRNAAQFLLFDLA